MHIPRRPQPANACRATAQVVFARIPEANQEYRTHGTSTLCQYGEARVFPAAVTYQDVTQALDQAGCSWQPDASLTFGDLCALTACPAERPSSSRSSKAHNRS
ncbi:hypothetical protein ACIQFZ_38445 [Streptomyces sp. NPDC093064]|uniref:hypothetical protein n=1 Tax=Streptomyces sp. NPDC093064 TaxID=3366020 RepID=UPI0038074B3F